MYGDTPFGVVPYASLEEVAGSSLENAINIDGVADIARGGTLDMQFSQTIAGNSAAARVLNISMQFSLSVGANGNFTAVPGFGYQATLPIDGVASATQTTVIDASLSIDGLANIAQSQLAGLVVTLSVGGVSNLTRANNLDAVASRSIAAVSGVTAVGGLHYFNQLPIEGFAAATQIAGFAYGETLDIDGIADTAQAELYVKNGVLTIAGVSDLTVAHLYTAGASLIVAGIAALARTGTRDSNESLTFNVLSVFFVENIYEFLYLLTSVAQVSATDERLTGNAFSQSASGTMSVACTGVFNRTLTQTLTMTQLARALKSIIVNSQTLTLTQQAVYSIIYTRSVSHTLTMTQQAVAFRECRNTLVMSQTVVCVKSKHLTVSQTLNLTQTLHRNIIVGRVLTDTLVFLEGQPKDSGIGVDLTSPSAVATLVPRSCLVIIGVPEQTVILPCPQFGDSEAYQGQVNVKRTMTGDTFTYVRKGRVEKLQYTFHVGTHKAYEMQKYLLSHAAKLHTVYNWKGEVWKVYITNNPVEFVAAERWQNKGERHEFTLELEGVKVS